jgi:hypothetical protein
VLRGRVTRLEAADAQTHLTPGDIKARARWVELLASATGRRIEAESLRADVGGKPCARVTWCDIMLRAGLANTAEVAPTATRATPGAMFP